MAPLSTNTIEHFLHPDHKLTELNDKTSYVCDGCKTKGEGTRFSCVSCQFDLHVYCANCPTMLTSTINHPHPMSRVVYEPKPKKTEANCQLCLQLIQGLVYECKRCSFLIHPICALHKSLLNQGSAQPSSSSAAQPSSISAAQRIGEHFVGGMAGSMAGRLMYDGGNILHDHIIANNANISKDQHEVLTADSNALGIHEDGGGFFDGVMSAFETFFSSM